MPGSPGRAHPMPVETMPIKPSLLETIGPPESAYRIRNDFIEEMYESFPVIALNCRCEYMPNILTQHASMPPAFLPAHICVDRMVWALFCRSNDS